MSNARLVLTDGTTEISLINSVEKQSGFYLESWRPSIPGYKGSGVWQESALSAGRVLVDKHFDNYIDTFAIKSFGTNQDAIIREMQNIRRLLEKASDYWQSGWSVEPVWIEARAVGETNIRYSVIYTGSIIEDENPYAQPFVKTCDTIMDRLTLVIEHGFWQDVLPGSNTQVELCERGFIGVVPLLFDMDGDDYVNHGSDATIDDLPDNFGAGKGVVTIDAWINPDSYGESGFGTIYAKGLNGNWPCTRFAIHSQYGLTGEFDYTGVNPLSASGLDEFSVDGYWHHVLMCYDETGGATPAARKIYLAIDGKWVSSYTVQTTATLVYNTDAAHDAYVGDIDRTGAVDLAFDGHIGWIRVSNSIVYPVGTNFDPPSRCFLPGADANTLILAIAEGYGTTAHNYGTSDADGTINDAEWDTDALCETECVTTTDSVYIANKRSQRELTHIFVDDGGAFSANLINNVAYELLPTVPVAGDHVYFGVDGGNSETFCSLVFDIGTAGTGYTARWEYWDGAAWSVLPAYDGTDTANPLDTLGRNVVIWEHQTDWAQVAVNGVTAMWVRVNVQTVPGPLVAPQQQNTPVYTILQPYIEIPAAQVGGDISALSKFKLQFSGDITDASASEFIIGLRSVSRGENFTAIINFAEAVGVIQNPDGIDVNQYAPGAILADVTASTGYSAQTIGNVGVWGTEFQIYFNPSIVQEYYGTYRAFIRARTDGTPGDILTRIVVGVGTSGYNDTYVSDPVAPSSAVTWELLDLGQFTFPGTGPGIYPDILSALTIDIEVYGTSGGGANSMYYQDFIMIPVDEWAIVVEEAYSALAFIDQYSLLTDSTRVNTVSQPHVGVYNTADNVYYIPPMATNGPSIWQANARQRLWVISRGYVITKDYDSSYEAVFEATAHKVQRYLSMRGDR